MNFKSFALRFAPSASKLLLKQRLCPWSSALFLLNPRTFSVYPPLENISIKDKTSCDFANLIEFSSERSFWFPKNMMPSSEMWSEYLVCFWDNVKNQHQYLRGNACISPGDIVWDCGACEGFFTRLALDSGAKQIISIEPSATMAECLRLTFEREIRDGRVVVLQTALGSFSGSTLFSCLPNDPFSGRVSKDGLPVAVMTGDDLLTNYGAPDFIKMDLEGSEFNCLFGASKTLKAFQPKLAITTYHNAWDFSAIHSLLRGLNYSRISPYGITNRGECFFRPVMLHAW